MVTIPILVMPILVSTVLVFLMSFLLWTVLNWHRTDYRGLPDETGVTEMLRRQAVGPGQYMFPWVGDRASMKDPQYMSRMEQGPVGVLTLMRPGPIRMGSNLGQWFAYVLVISVFVAYVSSRALPAGADYLSVFQIAGTVAILGYAAAVIPSGIWFGRPWRNVWKDVVDGVVYGLLTAGTFGWLWPE